ncbi:uncharacterized [Tachysurus ichikawai]
MEYHPSSSAQVFRVEVGLCLCQALALGREYALWLILLERSPDGSQNSLVANIFDGDPLAVDCESSLQTADCSPTEHVVLPSNPRQEEGGGRSLRKEHRGCAWLCERTRLDTDSVGRLIQSSVFPCLGCGSLAEGQPKTFRSCAWLFQGYRP